MFRKTVSATMLFLLLASTLTLAFKIQTVKAEPKTWIVDDDGPADFHTIQEAVAVANSGDTIRVNNGTYYVNSSENEISVGKSLKIIGENRNITFVEGTSSDPRYVLFRVMANDVEITGFTMRNFFYGVALRPNTSGVVIGDNTIENPEYPTYFSVGIDLNDADSNTITNNTITNPSCIAITMSFSSDNTISGNTIMNSVEGIRLEYNSSYNTMSDNVIYNIESIGLEIFLAELNASAECEGNVIIDNNISMNLGVGILLDRNNATICRNILTNNEDGGIIVSSGGTYVISGNTVVNNTEGIHLGGPQNSHASIFDNLIKNNTVGIYLHNSIGKIIYHNDFENNTAQTEILNSTDFWDNGYPSGGNYWSDYIGTDLYGGPFQNILGGDGIGDTPYVIDAQNQDRYPLMNPFPKVFEVTSSTRFDWSMFHGNLGHTGYSESPAPGTNQTQWNSTTSGEVYSSPAVANDIVFVGSNDSKVYALDQYNGTQIWNYTTGGAVQSSPTVADGKVYVGSFDRKVYCLNVSTGNLIWSYTTGDVVLSSPAVVGGRVYVGSWDKKIYCLPEDDPNANGVIDPAEVIWNYTTGGWITSSPAVAGNEVYVGSNDGKVYCLNASTGGLVWNYTTGSLVLSSPAVADGLVYVGSDDGKLYCLDASTGSSVWNYTTANWVQSSPAVADGKVFVGLFDGRVNCLNSSTGQLMWTYTTGSEEWCSPAVSDGIVFIGSGDHRVYAFGNVIRVPEDYPTVQQAIDAAAPGATIWVAPVTYYESLIINKRVAIIGKVGSEPIFNGGGSGIAITLLSNASGSTVTGIAVTYWDQGILVQNASDCRIYGNIISLMSSGGINLESAVNNLVEGNTISQNNVGINVIDSSNNKIFHNTFVGNTAQVLILTSTGNVWDDGYPSGGNYWSDHTSPDLYSGANQDVPGSDGIVDTNYTVTIGNVDRYPLVHSVHNVVITDVIMSKTVVGKGYTLCVESKTLNCGLYDENFLITAYANTYVAVTQRTSLHSQESSIIVLTWNTASFAYGNYTLSACVELVQGETNTANNNRTCTFPVHVGVPGDVSGTTPGVYDGITNMKDIAYLVSLFNTKPSSPNWMPNADVNNDAVVNMKDIAIAVYYFNQHE